MLLPWNLSISANSAHDKRKLEVVGGHLSPSILATLNMMQSARFAGTQNTGGRNSAMLAVV